MLEVSEMLIVTDSDETKKINGIPSYMLNGLKSGCIYFGETQIDGGMSTVGKPQNRDGHVLVLGGPGTGKSSCIAVPTLQSWKEPFFAIDIKGELTREWEKCQQGGSRPYKIFEFTDKDDSCKYDPFYFLRESNQNDLVQNAREIAQAIIPIPTDVRDTFWIQAAQNVLTAVILYVCGKEVYVTDPCTGEKTGETIRGTFNSAMALIQSKPIWDLIKEIGESGNEAAIKYINQFLGIEYPEDNKMLAGISAELSNRAMVFATDNRVIASFTSKDDEDMLRWEDLENSCVFMQIPEDKLGQWDGAITLMLTQLIRTLERRPDHYSEEGQSKNLPPVLLLLDEFPRLGKMDAIQNAVSTLRSKGVTICLMMQSLAQLDKIYGEATRRIILEGCHYKAILGVTDAESQKIISDMIGSNNVKKESIGYSESVSKGTNAGSNIGASIGPSTEAYGENSYSINWNESNGDSNGLTKSLTVNLSPVREPIIFPNELAALKDILLITPEGFCRVNKRPYYAPPARPVSRIRLQADSETIEEALNLVYRDNQKIRDQKILSKIAQKFRHR